MLMSYATAKAVDAAFIPVIDISDLRAGTPGGLRKVANDLAHAASTVGFFYVKNHGVPQALINDVFAIAREFFGQPLATKNEVKVNAIHRGFLKAGEAKMSDEAKPDLKESFIWGLDVGDKDPDYLSDRPLIGPNQWPGTVPRMRDAFMRYFDECNALGKLLLKAFATSLDVEADYFIKLFEKPLTRCSIIYYPPQPPFMGAEQFGVAPHSDFGTLTLLYQDSVGGLQVKDSNGEWVTAHPIDGTYVVNVGDLLARWTNNRFASTEHRVVNSSGRERLSCAAFVDPNFETAVTPVVKLGESAQFEAITAGEYLVKRFGKAFAYRNKPS
jgi:isopenicillin N synthase-like dioxygenase